ncbi:MAG: 2-phospho-L-lactate guanylyltransferase [Candidatus Rokubacteria bacterium GWC2_70_16]|nr:MAG: 2-phospho-L-lactate guanylyltransferase [Candidatus Rokubacteria bacterium GWC2_70_16]
MSRRLPAPTLVAVPVKDLDHAKQRLIPLLEPAERRALAAAMLEDVLAALVAAALGPLCVVTKDEAVLALAGRQGIRCLTESANRGHTEAVALAQREAVRLGLARFLTIPGDVPCVTRAELERLGATLDAGPGVAFVPSLSGFGTNAALLSPPAAMPLKFGEPSFDNHLEAARERGLSPVVLPLPGIGLDIDAPEDLGLLLERGSATRSGTLLRAWDIPRRLASLG